MNSAQDTSSLNCSKSESLAIVGVSGKDFGGAIYKELKKRGYRVFAVNPTRPDFDGDRCYSSIRDLPPDVKRAVIAVSPEHAVSVVDDAIAHGCTHLWFQQGPDFRAGVAKAEASGIETVSKKCILMYSEPVTGFHKFHQVFAKVFGRY